MWNVAFRGVCVYLLYKVMIYCSTLLLDLTSELTIHTSEIDQTSDLIRPLHIRNTFSRPLVIYNVSITEDISWLKVHLCFCLCLLLLQRPCITGTLITAPPREMAEMDIVHVCTANKTCSIIIGLIWAVSAKTGLGFAKGLTRFNFYHYTNITLTLH